MRKLWFIVLLCSVLCATASTPSYWFSGFQTKPDAKQAQEYFFLEGTNILFTYTNNRVVINSTGGGGGGTNAGPQGPVGPTGPVGPSGANGLNGTNGVNGTNGLAGMNGTNGLAGLNGTNGLNGVNGTNGAAGPNGTNVTAGVTTNFSLFFMDTGQTNILYFTNGVLVYIVHATHPLATSWASRVVINGGASPSSNTVFALSTFCYALDAASLSSKMIAVNCFAPDSLIAAITPLIVGPGNDPWINHNNAFHAGDLTVNGLHGDGATTFLQTGVKPSDMTGQPNSGGYTIYFYTCPSEASTDLAVYLSPDQAGLFNLSGTVIFDCWNYSSGATSVSLPGFIGYVSGNRVSASETHIYAANSGTAHYSAGGSSGAPGTAPNADLWAWAMNATGTPSYLSTKRLSFIAMHQGLTATASLNFYNAVQALRVALGGGYN